MKKDLFKLYTVLVALIWTTGLSFGQNKGHLFIIGGGDRSPALMQELVQTAQLSATDYIVILPMATSIPEESIAYVSQQLSEHCQNRIASFNFTPEQANNRQDWIDSVQNARLIYVTGGDQNKFMDVVRGSKLYDALHHAYRHGATISGTSAGAAIMSQIMITGAQKGDDDSGTFREIKSDYAVTSEGMGFLTDVIIDQHFIMRSRYNRLLSLLSDYPDKIVVGIDEATAVVITGKHAKVVGESQVVVITKPKKVQKPAHGKVAFRDAKLSLLTHGQSFKLK
jgi:cyanophycinase